MTNSAASGGRAFLALLLVGVFLVLPLASATAYDDAVVFGVLEAKDGAKQTLTVNGVDYRVSSRTRYYDREGGEIGFDQLVPFDRMKAGLYEESAATNVELTVMHLGTQLMVMRLQLVEKLPD